MKTRLVVVSACLGSLILFTNAYGQAGQRGPAARGPADLLFSRLCPLGPDIGIIDGVEAFDIEGLIQSSELVIKGTVVRVLPSEAVNKNMPNVMHTTSLISVDEVLRGTAPPSNTVAITQLGGRDPQCVQDSTLVELREEYILFLLRDPTTDIPNNSGSPRYAMLGFYGGKAKIVDGKIQFSPRAHERLREYDNMDLAMFKDIVKRGVDVRKLRPVDKPPGTPIPPPEKKP